MRRVGTTSRRFVRRVVAASAGVLVGLAIAIPVPDAGACGTSPPGLVDCANAGNDCQQCLCEAEAYFEWMTCYCAMLEIVPELHDEYVACLLRAQQKFLQDVDSSMHGRCAG